MDILALPWPILFLEFFIREVTFRGKGKVRATLPADANFYSGESKAQRYHATPGNRWSDHAWDMCQQDLLKLPSSPTPLTFINNYPALCFTDQPNKLVEQWRASDTHIVFIMSGEFLFNAEWIRREVQLKTCRHPESTASFAPYGFNISMIGEKGAIWTQFPRPEISLKIAPEETACFLCRREEYLFGYDEAHNHYQPNLNLVMWVKNYGLHQSAHCVSQSEIRRIDSSALCREDFTIRDFRKNRSKYQLG